MTKEGLQRAARHVSIFFAVILCLFYSAVLARNYAFFSKFSNDFGVYWRAANQQVEQVYFWAGDFPFPYMPTMLLWTSPLELVPKWPAYFLFIICSAAAFIIACRPYLNKPQIALALISPPLSRGFYTGQVCALLTAMLIWACGARNRIAAGVAFGIIASIKPQFVIMAPLMLALNRDWKAFAAAAVSFAGTVLLSLALFGAARWSEWFASLSHFRSVLIDNEVINIAITPASIAERNGLPPLPFMLGGGAVGAVIVYLCRDAEPLEKASAIALGSLLAAPYALEYDLTALVPLLVLSIWRGNFFAVPALSVMIAPLALIVSAIELTWRKLWGLNHRRLRNA